MNVGCFCNEPKLPRPCERASPNSQQQDRVREEQKAPTLCDGIHDWNSVIPTGLSSREYEDAGSERWKQVANKEGLGAFMQTC